MKQQWIDVFEDAGLDDDLIDLLSDIYDNHNLDYKSIEHHRLITAVLNCCLDLEKGAVCTDALLGIIDYDQYYASTMMMSVIFDSPNDLNSAYEFDYNESILIECLFENFYLHIVSKNRTREAVKKALFSGSKIAQDIIAHTIPGNRLERDLSHLMEEGFDEIVKAQYVYILDHFEVSEKLRYELDFETNTDLIELILTDLSPKNPLFYAALAIATEYCGTLMNEPDMGFDSFSDKDSNSQFKIFYDLIYLHYTAVDAIEHLKAIVNCSENKSSIDTDLYYCVWLKLRHDAGLPLETVKGAIIEDNQSLVDKIGFILESRDDLDATLTQSVFESYEQVMSNTSQRKKRKQLNDSNLSL